MSTDRLVEEFKMKAPLYEQLRQEALYALENALADTTIKYHSLPSRVKELDSFLKKLQSKSTEKPTPEIQDIVGLRVVCLFLSDVARVGDIIRKTFNVLSEDNKIEGAEVSSFGYMSVHFIVTMRDEFHGPRYDNIRNMTFEIQVRTIAMDAWANVSHYLDYKSERDVPDELRKDFYALSGLFYLADRHYEMFYGESIRSRKEMTQLFEKASEIDKAGQLVNADSLSAYLHTKFPDRKHGNSKAVSALVNQLLKSGYSTMGEIDKDIDKARSAFTQYEQEHPPGVEEGQKLQFMDVGVIRVSLGILNDDFLRESQGNLEDVRAVYKKYREMLSANAPRIAEE